MTPQAFLRGIVEPAAGLLGDRNSPDARCLLLAIAGQESEWEQRLQEPVAYARGFWQCEKNGAVLEVLTNDATKDPIANICRALCIPTGLDKVFEAIAWNDALAYVVARLNLWLDPQALPAIGDAGGSWDCYVRTWRPGKPDQSRWQDIYPAASGCFGAQVSSR